MARARFGVTRGGPQTDAKPTRAKKKAPPIGRGFCRMHGGGASVDAGPVLAAAEYAAEGATLDAQAVGAFQRDRRVIGAAGVRIEDPAAPFGVLAGLHVDQNLFAVLVRFLVDGIAAKISAALLNPDL